jgi:hypothetical protein
LRARKVNVDGTCKNESERCKRKYQDAHFREQMIQMHSFLLSSVRPQNLSLGLDSYLADQISLGELPIQ